MMCVGWRRLACSAVHFFPDAVLCGNVSSFVFIFAPVGHEKHTYDDMGSGLRLDDAVMMPEYTMELFSCFPKHT